MDRPLFAEGHAGDRGRAAPLISIGLAALGFAIGRREVWFLILGVIVLMLIAAALVLVRRRFGIRYRLTTQRFIQEKGIVTRQTDRIDIIDINDIRVEQGPIERLLDIGTMIVMANDRTDANLTMPGIENVNHVADLMDNARRAVQRSADSSHRRQAGRRRRSRASRRLRRTPGEDHVPSPGRSGHVARRCARREYRRGRGAGDIYSSPFPSSQ